MSNFRKILGRIDDAIAAAEADQRAAVDGAQGRRGIGVVKNARADVLVILGDHTAGAFVEHHQARAIRFGNAPVRVVH